MSIKIHHGPAGSYKTSGCIADDFVPAAKAGRIIVTNIRGLSDRTLVYDILDGVPESFELHYLPTTDHEDAAKNRLAFATFFHWLPIGALMIVDEAQMIYPKAWTSADLRKLNYPGGIEKASADKRPSDIWIAFDMHRHYNWDIIFTTTNITKIRDDIRNVADMAYRHRDMALIGWHGRYFETQHQPEDNGSSQANQISTRIRKIPSYVWKLYSSTATGVHKRTVSGFAFYMQTKVVLSLLVLAYLIYSVTTSDPILSSHKPVKPDIKSVPSPVPSSLSSVTQSSSYISSHNENTFSDGTDVLDPLHAYRLYIYGFHSLETQGTIVRQFYIMAFNEDETMKLKTHDLQYMGYTLDYIDNCNLRIIFKGKSRFISCGKSESLKKQQQSLAAVVPTAQP